jgi:hypothetical protein
LREEKKMVRTLTVSLGLLTAMFSAVAVAAGSLAPGIDLIPGEFTLGRQPDGNTIVVRSGDGLVVFDTGRHREHTQSIIDFARREGLPVKVIINSHWHLDHVGGNPMLRKEYPDVRVYASGAIEAALHGFLAEYRASLEKQLAAAPGSPADIQLRACLPPATWSRFLCRFWIPPVRKGGEMRWIRYTRLTSSYSYRATGNPCTVSSLRRIERRTATCLSALLQRAARCSVPLPG